MSEPTNSVIIRKWTDDPDFGCDADEWPYPNEYTESLITGELADRVRARLQAPADARVIIKETCISGGYSEWTQENDYDFELRVNGDRVELESGWDGNTLTPLLRWLDGEA